jgi:glutaredoxin
MITMRTVFRLSSVNLVRPSCQFSKAKKKAAAMDSSTVKVFNFKKHEERMQKCVEKFKHDLAELRIGRANPSNYKINTPAYCRIARSC